jgi:ABC-2 type transport system permease protein
MVSPVFYDFKRGLLRPTVLISLAIFALVGVGLAYLVLSVIAMNPAVRPEVAYYSVLDNSTGRFKLKLHIYNPELNPIDGEVSYKLGCYDGKEVDRLDELYTKGLIGREEYSKRLAEILELIDEGVYKSSDGKVVVEKKLERLPLQGFTCELYLNISTPLGSMGTIYTPRSGAGYISLVLDNNTMYVLTGVGMPLRPPSKIMRGEVPGNPEEPINIRGLAGAMSATIYDFGGRVNKSVLLLTIYSPLVEEFEIYIRSTPPGAYQLSLKFVERYFNYTGRARVGVNVIEVNASLLKRETRELPGARVEVTVLQSLLLLVLARSEDAVYIGFGPAEIRPVQPGISQLLIVQQLTSQIGPGLFTQFFPILVLYLVYVYIAKPRAQGALEFTLARPITRTDLYITRFTAGALVVIASAVLFNTTFLIAVQSITKLNLGLDVVAYALMYGGVIVSLLAFYSLCYLLSTLTSGTRYIVVSVILYVLYAFIWGVLPYIVVSLIRGFGLGYMTEVMKLSFIMAYFNPIGLNNFYQLYLLKHVFGEEAVPAFQAEAARGIVEPWFVAIATIAWLLVPALLGWLRFKKISLIA